MSKGSLRAGDARMSRWYLDPKGRHLGYGRNVGNHTRIDDAEIEAFVESLGGDVEEYRAALAMLDEPSTRTFGRP
jgi:hypothetical protein